MKHVPRDRTAATMVALAVLLPSFATATTLAKPIPLEQVILWSDAIVVGVTQDADTLGLPKTIDVEQWIVPAHSKSKTLRIQGGNSYKARFGRRVLLLLSLPRSLMPSTYSALQVIDLEDANDVAWGLDELNSPWIPYVTTTTTYAVIDCDSHPIKSPEADPLLIEIERILEAARAKINGR